MSIIQIQMCTKNKKQCVHESSCELPPRSCTYTIDFCSYWIWCEFYNHVKGDCEHEKTDNGYCSEEECPLLIGK